MKFTKPAWVIHNDTGKNDIGSKRLSIFTIDVHPDGSRIATGGIDCKIRIWSTKPILNEATDLAGKMPKTLCTLAMHTGPVLCVRWSKNGRRLASGSDDSIVMIWDLDPAARGKVWGSDEVNVEGWKPLKRLPGHNSDVTDLAWSPKDRYLASVGLDSKVIIWCGYTLERLARLDQHQGFVKGVCWDPVGEFLATQSDDRTVKIWRTGGQWSLEATVGKPFEDSPGSTFFRRLSWSPDGAHITASNATNNKGMVFIAAVITRYKWNTDISLVGHENTVEVAAYNPHMFLRDPEQPLRTENLCSVVALGADDRSISVWQTKTARPIVVAKEVFERQIWDLSWSKDGLNLYAASSDGTIGLLTFELSELVGLVPENSQEQYLTRFGYVPPPLPAEFQDITSTPQGTNAASALKLSNGAEVVNTLVAKRGAKDKDKHRKRVQLFSTASASLHLNGLAGERSTVQSTSASSVTPRAGSSRLFLQPTRDRSVSPYAGDTWNPPYESPADVSTTMNYIMDSAPISHLGDRVTARMNNETAKPSKGRTLGGDLRRESVDVRPLAGPSHPRGGPSEWERPLDGLLPVPVLLNLLSSKADGSDVTLEAKNAEDGSPTEVWYMIGKKVGWVDYVKSPVVALTATQYFCAIAMQDGSVAVYSPTGRLLMPILSLGSVCAYIDGQKYALMVITTAGQVFSWNTKSQSAIFTPTSILPLLTSSPNANIVSATVQSNGSPVIICSTGIAHSYDPTLFSWIKLSDQWWSLGSDAWQARSRHSQVAISAAARGNALSSIESQLNLTSALIHQDSEATPRPKWWNTALTLGHLESKIFACRNLDSPSEYKQSLLVYAKRIADEGFRDKAEELIKELFGPVYWRPTANDNGFTKGPRKWESHVLGLAKRDLLKDVLSVFVRSKTLAKLGLDWQDILRKASSSGDV